MGAVTSRAYERLRDDDGRRYRSIRLPSLPIVPPRASALRPPKTVIRSATIHVLFECYEEIEKKNRFGDDDLDRIRRTDFQVCVDGNVDFKGRVVVVQDHWRIDTHYFGGDQPAEPHPWCHFQRGGHAQDEFSASDGYLPGNCVTDLAAGLSLRALMQSSSPRIAIPPMDPICAIDFVIAQHDGDIWRRLSDGISSPISRS